MLERKKFRTTKRLRSLPFFNFKVLINLFMSSAECNIEKNLASFYMTDFDNFV